MNKQELLEKIKALKPDEQCLHEYQPEEWEAFQDGFDDGKCYVELIIEQLDEPVRPPVPKPLEIEKPVVPQFVADWLENCKDNLALSLASSMTNLVMRINNQPNKTINWVAKNSETFAKAWIYGYEVEKEKLYTVEIPNPNSAGGKTVLSKQQSTGRLIVEMLNSDINKPKYLHLTEAEIKKDFAWAWKFAEEVNNND